MRKKREGSIVRTVVVAFASLMALSLLVTLAGTVYSRQAATKRYAARDAYQNYLSQLYRFRVCFAEITCMERDIASQGVERGVVVRRFYDLNVYRIEQTLKELRSFAGSEEMTECLRALESAYDEYMRISQMGVRYYLEGERDAEFLALLDELPWYPYAEHLSQVVIPAEALTAVSETHFAAQMRRNDAFLGQSAYLMISLNLIVFAALSLFAVLFIRKSLRPVRRLMEDMERIESGDFALDAVPTANNEIGRLTTGVHHMAETIRVMLQTRERDEIRKRKLELSALSYRLTPHFLYHTIHSIHWLARLNNVVSIEKMTAALIKLLRFQSRSDEFITLAEEMALLESYFSIQRYRFPDKFRTEFRLPPDLAQTKVLPMLLQPLGENAIFHGIQPLADEGEIVVEAAAQGPDVRISISDSGVGISDEVLRMLNGGVRPPSAETDAALSDSKEEGFGEAIQNIRDRLRLRYGDRVSLRFAHREGGGTVVTVCYPAEPDS
ncbi:MAG: histidine kinase [Oscillospiraceae bacterium]|jgi:sensor histidine kinase YesM|nr:histidine kinase [Oscillospiraceae bacterium]